MKPGNYGVIKQEKQNNDEKKKPDTSSSDKEAPTFLSLPLPLPPPPSLRVPGRHHLDRIDHLDHLVPRNTAVYGLVMRRLAEMGCNRRPGGAPIFVLFPLRQPQDLS